jgi:hypothetical protein
MCLPDSNVIIEWLRLSMFEQLVPTIYQFVPHGLLSRQRGLVGSQEAEKYAGESRELECRRRAELKTKENA